MRRVLITGTAGFLGSHLALHYLAKNWQVLGVDNFCSSLGTFTNWSPHFRKLQEHPNYFHLNEDIASEDFNEKLEEEFGRNCDLVLNFACPASPPRYQAMPIETMMTCVVGTRNILGYAARSGAVVVHASTSEVYGDPDVSPQTENYRGCVNSYGPRSCYDEGKRAAEALCFDYHNKYNVDARLVRIFNTYGTHMDPNDGRVVSNFICQALLGEPITIYGHGQQTRSFCYVDDLIRGIVAMADLKFNPLQPINLGNPHEFKVIELAEIIANRVGGAKIAYAAKAMPIDDPQKRCPSIYTAQSILGWKPTVSLEEGLDKTIEYFRCALK